MPLVAIGPANRCPLSNPRQVFERECLAGHDGFVDQRLADHVVGMGLEPRLTPPHAADAALGVTGADFLEAAPPEMGAVAYGVHQGPGEMRACAVGSEIDNAQVPTPSTPPSGPASGGASRLCVTCR